MDNDREFMEMAVAAAREAKCEDHRPHPLVGVVVVKDGQVVGRAHRGEMAPGDHAEYTVLEKKLSGVLVAGSTVYTTLEPCTTRNHPKVPCVQRLVEHRVSRVVIGMLDPNPNILGRGILRLRESGITVDLFPPDLMSQLEELNRDFIRVHPMPPAISEELIRRLTKQSLDDWYKSLNRVYWNRNFQRSASDIFMHLVEVIGSLSVLVSKKTSIDVSGQKYMAKAIAWWDYRGV